MFHKRGPAAAKHNRIMYEYANFPLYMSQMCKSSLRHSCSESHVTLTVTYNHRRSPQFVGDDNLTQVRRDFIVGWLM